MKALFGGTFNPVHQGHIALARQVCSVFALERVEFIPSFVSVHRAQPETSPELRRQMLEIALQPYPELSLNNCELQRGGRSYTVDTLRQLKATNPAQSMCWLMGVDSFNGFADWYRPDEILQLAHLIVCTRPGITLDQGRFAQHFLQADEKLQDFEAGRIVLFDMTPSDCASSRIREQLARGETAPDCLARPVLEFIQQNDLYKVLND